MAVASPDAIARQSLGAISSQIGLVSRNIAGAHVDGYSVKTAQVTTGIDGFAHVSSVTRATNDALFQTSLRANSAQAGQAALLEGMSRLDSLINVSAGAGGDANHAPAAFISKLASALQQYSSTPSDRNAANAAVGSAKDLVNALHDATAEVQRVRGQADADIAASVANLNSLLAQFQNLNTSIVTGTAAGRDVTDSLDQRDNLLTQISSEIGIRTLTRSNNDTVIYTDGGATLFETTARTVSFGSTSTFSASTSGNPVYVDGVQATGTGASMPSSSGKIKGLAELRDKTLPQYQNQLDEIARGLVRAFSEQNQTVGLFTYSGAPATPGASIVKGLASDIKVNAAVDPEKGGNVSLLRDGITFTYNTSGGASYSARILQLVANMSDSTITAFDDGVGNSLQQSLTSYANFSIGSLEGQRQQASTAKGYQDALLSQSRQSLSNATGVNIDDQMSKMLDLENSYQATGKLIEMVSNMFSSLFQAVSTGIRT